MSHEEKFSREISDFQRYGIYSYSFDEAGNVVLNPNSNNFSQVFLGFSLGNFVYDNGKIEAFYDPTFREFVPASQIEQQQTEESIRQMQEDLNAEKEKTDALITQLNSLVELSNESSTEANNLATKQVILELRKALGQGRVDSDFSDDFPYSPIKKSSSIISNTESKTVLQTAIDAQESMGGDGAGIQGTSSPSLGGSDSTTETVSGDTSSAESSDAPREITGGGTRELGSRTVVRTYEN
jgi:hypothetical protein